MKKVKDGLLYKKLSGFTVQETIVAMVITGLIAALSFTIIRYYQQLFYNVVGFGNTQTEINQLQQVLTNDIANARTVNYSSDLICSTNNSNVQYLFIKDKIVRLTEISADTFKIGYTKPITMFLEGSDNLVTHLTLTCKNKDVELPISVSKQYPLAIQLENKE